MITSQQGILKELKSFYKNLRQSKCNKDQALHKNSFLDNSNIERLSRTEQIKCEGVISENEIKIVLKLWKMVNLQEQMDTPQNKYFW